MFKYIRNISAKNQTIIPFDFLFDVFLNDVGEKNLTFWILIIKYK